MPAFELNENLKPCPFCMSVLIEMHSNDEIGGSWPDQISCLQCGVTLHGYKDGFLNGDKLIDLWNNRSNAKAQS